MRDLDELAPIIDEQFERMREEIFNANRLGEDELRVALTRWNWNEDVVESPIGAPGRVLVVGESQVKETVLARVATECGFDSNNIDFVLGYKTNFRFDTLEFNDTYSDVLFGPLPHSQNGKRRSSSIITQMEAAPDRWPNPIRLTANGALKITKESFAQGLIQTKAFNQREVNSTGKMNGRMN